MVYVNRAGVLSRRRDLEACLREEWDRNRANILADIKTREAADAPLSDAEDGSAPLEDPGEYQPEPDWADVAIVLRVIHPSEAEVYDFMVAEASDMHTDAKSAGDDRSWRDIVEVNEAFRDAWRHLMRCAIVEVHGLRDSAGSYSLTGGLNADDVDALERAGLLHPLMVAARSFQHLSEQERGNFGGSLPSTSAATAMTVRPVPSTAGNGSVAMAAGPSGSGAPVGGATSQTSAPSASLSATDGLVGPASFIGLPGAASVRS